MSQIRTLADLQIGEKAHITRFADVSVAAKFIEMGCLPNSEVTLLRHAPFGCPFYVKIENHHYAIRRREAALVLVG